MVSENKPHLIVRRSVAPSLRTWLSLSLQKIAGMGWVYSEADALSRISAAGEKTEHYDFCVEHKLAMQRTFCSFPALAPSPYFPEDAGRPVSEYFWLPMQQKFVSWTDAQKPATEGGDPHIAHMLAALDGLDDDAGDTNDSTQSVYSHLVARGVDQSVMSLADAVYAKTWSVDLKDLSAAECAKEGSKAGFNPGPNNMILEHGQKEMLDVMAQGLDIRFKTKVVSVEQQHQQKRHLVRTNGGVEFTASQVVLAVPMNSYRLDSDLPLTIRPEIPQLSAAAAVSNKVCIRVGGYGFVWLHARYSVCCSFCVATINIDGNP